MTPARGARAWSRRGLQTRIVLVVAVAMLGPAAILAWVGWTGFAEWHHELLTERRLLGHSVADHVDSVVRSDLELLQTMAAGPRAADQEPDLGAERAAVRDTYLRSRLLEEVLMLGERGELLWEEPSRARLTPPRLTELAAVRDVLRTGRPDVSELVDEPGGRKRLYLLVPVRSWEGRVVRVAVGGIDPESQRVRSLVPALSLGDRGSTDLVDRRGIVIATTEPARRYLRSDHGQFMEGLIRERKSAAGTCHGCHESSQVRGRQREVLAFVPLSVVPWGIAVRQPEEEAFAPLAALRRRLLLLGPAVVAVAVLFAWGAARSIRQPLGLLTGAAERIAGGDLAQAIPPLGDDEVGRLARSLEQMRAALRASLDAIGLANQDLEQRVAARTRELTGLYRQLQERDQARARLLRTVISAQEDERKRIARELHDETSQSLAAVVMGLEAAVAAPDGVPDRVRLRETREVAVRALDELHRLMLDLRPSVLDDLGLTSAIRWCAERHLEPLGIAVRCEFSGLPSRLPPELETTLFRVVQEAVTNIAKHAEAETVLIQCAARPDAVTIEVEDDGKGFAPGTAAAGTGLGLTGMRERIELLGGTFEIESAPSQGTRIALTVPVAPDGDRE